MPLSKESTQPAGGQVEDREKVVDVFLTASRALMRVAVQSIDAADPPVTAPQHRLMVLLAARGPQIVGDLASELNVNSSSATRQCDRLERKGLVTRTRSETDGRAVVVSLTPAGKNLLRTVTETRRAEIAAVVHRMDESHVREALSSLQSFSAAAGEPADGDWSDGMVV
jgi:DNA-binding MarR family transcriptional regulator